MYELIKRATVYFITPKNKLILVRQYSTGKLYAPQGVVNREIKEHPFHAALRHFQSCTGFLIDFDAITCQYLFFLTHFNGLQTACYFIKSTQRFPVYLSNRNPVHTIGLQYKSITKIKNQLYSDNNVTKNKYTNFFINDTKQLFEYNLFSMF